MALGAAYHDRMPTSTPISHAAADRPEVDCHAHIYHAAMPLAAGAWHRTHGEALLEDYMAQLSAHGVRRGVLAAVSLYGTYNEYALEACRRYPQLRTTVILDPQTPLAELRRLDGAGVVGIRMQWMHVPAPPDLSTPAWRTHLRHLAELGWHVQLHDDSRRLMEPLEHLEAAGVNIVVDHFGRPDAQLGTQCPGFQRVLRSVQTGRTWVKLSSAFRLAAPHLAHAAAEQLLRHAGPQRLLWGSDWPFTAFESTVSYAQTLDMLAAVVPDRAARLRIGGETPLNLFFH
jgi:predicted TIM-barrel fold metal-dependent hydrolase